MKHEIYAIEYQTLGEWRYWKSVSSKRDAELAIANRCNPVAVCRIRKVDVCQLSTTPKPASSTMISNSRMASHARVAEKPVYAITAAMESPVPSVAPMVAVDPAARKTASTSQVESEIDFSLSAPSGNRGPVPPTAAQKSGPLAPEDVREYNGRMIQDLWELGEMIAQGYGFEFKTR